MTQIEKLETPLVPADDFARDPLIPVATPFKDQEGEPISLPMERGVFRRLSDFFKERDLYPVSGRNAVIFVAAGVAVAAAGVAIAKKMEENRSAAVVVHEDKKKRGLPLTDEQKEEFAGIYELNKSIVEKYFAFKLVNPDQIEELTARVFERAYNRFAAFIPNPELENPHLPWLYRIARNVLLNYLRDYYRHPEVSLDTEPSPFRMFPAATIEGKEYLERQMTYEEEHREFGKAYSKLPVRYQTVLFLEAVVGQEGKGSINKTIGKIMGLSEGGVKSLKVRAFKSLGKKLAKLEKPSE